MTNKKKVEYVRNFIFGVEDSLVSTVGLVSGVAVAGVSNKNVVLTGMVLVFVEAFSMAVGSLLSENSADEYESKSEVALSGAVGYSVVMFGSYLLSGILIVL
ncbi:MAG: VIT1/CCC1 transporter family protein, partial [Candidatus Doudnabacteria bacterium]|nr:VIT1/CCC1 transporter family protein [Candidatus Doudnabacteria bacterium]